MELGDKCLDSELWHACAGGMVRMPPVNSKVYYFPQGHAEHALTTVNFSVFQKRLPPMFLCRVSSLKYLADPDTDEVYARIKLSPILHDPGFDDGASGSNAAEPAERHNSFAKTLTQSDANNGGGFSVPRYCAETIFPPLDYSADPPVQNLTAKDVHGQTWSFRHIYRGTPRRHLLTTGWSAFVNRKKLVAGDSIVFLRANNGEIFVGIRRVKKSAIGGSDTSSGWSSVSGNDGSLPSFLRGDENKTGGGSSGSSSGGGFRDRGRVKAQYVLEAVRLASSGKPFEVVYYPRASSAEFCVKSSSVYSALRIRWCEKMRFKMAFETEDCSRISWFMGTVTAVKPTDPFIWPESPWRLLQVAWDDPDLLPNVKQVSPWVVELVSNMPMMHMPPFSPPRKKLCLPQDLSLDTQFQLPSFSGNALGACSCVSDNISASIQGARQVRSGRPLLDLLNNKLQLGLSPPSLSLRIPDGIAKDPMGCSEDASCSLTIGSSYTQKLDKTENEMTPRFLLFGQPILTEQQMSGRSPTDAASQIPTAKNSTGRIQLRTEGFPIVRKGFLENLSSASYQENQPFRSAELGIDTGRCNVTLESGGDVAQTLDLTVVNSYEELYRKLAQMFGIGIPQMVNRVLYQDATGAVKLLGIELFSEFKRKVKRLTILMNPDERNAGVVGRGPHWSSNS